MCKSSSFSDIASPLSSRCKRDLRLELCNTTVGFMEYSDIGGLRIGELNSHSARVMTYKIMEFAAFVRFDTVATCGSVGEGHYSLGKRRSKNRITHLSRQDGLSQPHFGPRPTPRRYRQTRYPLGNPPKVREAPLSTSWKSAARPC